MNRIRRLAAIVTGLAVTWLGLAAAAPAAFAEPVPPVGGGFPGSAAPTGISTVTRTLVAGGMPGWQITLIAAAAALLAAAVAVLVDHRGRGTYAWSMRGSQPVPPARDASPAALLPVSTAEHPHHLVTGARHG